MKVRSLLILSLLIASVLLVIFGSVPKYQEGKQVEALIPVRQQELNEKLELKRKLDELRAKLSQIEEEALRIEQIVPISTEIPELTVSLDEIAKRNGVVLRGIRFGGSNRRSTPVFRGAGASANVKEYEAMSIAMNFSGTYESLEGFLINLEKSLRLIDVTSVSIIQAGEENTQNVFDFSVSANAYYLK